MYIHIHSKDMYLYVCICAIVYVSMHRYRYVHVSAHVYVHRHRIYEDLCICCDQVAAVRVEKLVLLLLVVAMSAGYVLWQALPLGLVNP